MKLGSLFSGYGGLDLAIHEVFPGTTTAWVSDIESGPRKILSHRFPGAPNIGDLTLVDWGDLEQVDIIAGGSPCQDLSSQGKRAGMKPGTRSGLWEAMWHAIKEQRPRLVIWENVGGAYSGEAFCNLEPEPGCLGNQPGRVVLRALGRVLGDLATIGYDAEWTSLRASDLGAPHRRERVFVLAYPRGSALPQIGHHKMGALIPTGRQIKHFLPTPTTSDFGGGAADLKRETLSLRSIWNNYGIARREVADLNKHPIYGQYEPAIRRWEAELGRQAGPPTYSRDDGRLLLRAAFVEWMMGLPPGWVTEVPGLTRGEQFRALGNGVVPQQGAHAIRLLLAAAAQETA